MKEKVNNNLGFNEFIIIIWNSKIKLIFFTAIFFLLSLYFYDLKKDQISGRTEIGQITIFDESKYTPYNNFLKQNRISNPEFNFYFDFIEINKEYLLNLYLDEFRDRNIIIDALTKYKLIDRSKFNSEESYLNAIKKKAFNLKILPPINIDGKSRREIRNNWIIEIQTNNKEKWNSALEYIDNEANKKILKFLDDNFLLTYENIELKKNFLIKKIEQEINVTRQEYDLKMKSRLAFLEEQALIARELNIVNNTYDNIENFNKVIILEQERSGNYYMLGHKMIEKEIELLKKRQNKDLFIENINTLFINKTNLIQDNTLEEISTFINKTPISEVNNFKAAIMNFRNTNYQSIYSFKKLILIGIFFGFTFGIVYIFFENLIRSKK